MKNNTGSMIKWWFKFLWYKKNSSSESEIHFEKEIRLVRFETWKDIKKIHMEDWNKKDLMNTRKE